MSVEADFETFWNCYPRRIGKLAARREYARARKHATADAILAGVMAYKLHMPREMQFVPHPRTYLSQGRWMDEDVPVVERDWFEECKRLHNGDCGLSQQRHATRKQLDEMKATLGDAALLARGRKTR